MGNPIKHKYFGQPTAVVAKAVYTVSADGQIKAKIKEAGAGYEGNFKRTIKEGDEAIAEFSFVVKDGSLESVEVTQEGEFTSNRKETAIELPAVANDKQVILGRAVLDKSRGAEDVFVVKQKGTYHWVVAAVSDPEITARVQLVGHAPKEVGECAFVITDGSKKHYVRAFSQYAAKTFDGESFPFEKIFS